MILSILKKIKFMTIALFSHTTEFVLVKLTTLEYFGTQGAFDGNDITSVVQEVSEAQGANITYTYVKIYGVHLNAVVRSMNIYKDRVHYSAYVTERIVSAVYGEEIS